MNDDQIPFDQFLEELRQDRTSFEELARWYYDLEQTLNELRAFPGTSTETLDGLPAEALQSAGPWILSEVPGIPGVVWPGLPVWQRLSAGKVVARTPWQVGGFWLAYVGDLRQRGGTLRRAMELADEMLVADGFTLDGGLPIDALLWMAFLLKRLELPGGMLERPMETGNADTE